MIKKVTSDFYVVKTFFFGFKNYSYVLFAEDDSSVAIVDPAWEMEV